MLYEEVTTKIHPTDSKEDRIARKCIGNNIDITLKKHVVGRNRPLSSYAIDNPDYNEPPPTRDDFIKFRPKEPSISERVTGITNAVAGYSTGLLKHPEMHHTFHPVAPPPPPAPLLLPPTLSAESNTVTSSVTTTLASNSSCAREEAAAKSNLPSNNSKKQQQQQPTSSSSPAATSSSRQPPLTAARDGTTPSHAGGSKDGAEAEIPAEGKNNADVKTGVKPKHETRRTSNRPAAQRKM